MTNKLNQLLTTAEAAAYINVTERQLTTSRDRGFLINKTSPKHIKNGRFVYYYLTELEFWLDMPELPRKKMV